MAVKVEIVYEAEATSLKATVNEVNKANDAVVASAQESSKEVANAYKSAGKSIAAAFSGGEVKKALADNNKSFDQLTSKGKTLTGQLRSLKNELSQLESSGKAGTAQFRQLTFEAARLEDQIGDTRARVANLASDTFKFDAAVQATQGLAAGFEIAQGAAALFGSESEDLQKALIKVQAATAIANGVQQVANLLLEESKIKTFLLTNAQTALAFVTGTSTGVLKAFRIALAATGVGLLVIGLIALVENFDKVKRALENSIPFFKDVSNAIGGVVDTIKDWVGASEEADRAGAAFEKASKRQADATKQIVDGYNRRIEVEKAAGRNTTQLEIEREKAVIEASKKILKDYQIKSTELIKLDEEQKQKAIDTATEARDAIIEAENNILVIKTTASKEAADKAKEAAKKAAEDEKKEIEKLESDRKALLAKRVANQKAANDSIAASREADLQEELAAVAVADDASFTLKIASLEKQKAIEIEAAETAGLLTYEIAKKYDDLIAEQRKQQAEAQLNTELNILRELEIEQGSTLDRRIEIINLEAKARRKAATDSIKDEKERASAIELINAETEKAIREERKKTTEQAVDDALEIAQATADVLGKVLELQGLQSEQRIEQINAASEAEKLAIEQSSALEADKQRQLDALDKRTQSRINQERAKQAKNEKALAIFNTIINTAAAVMKAGGPLNPVGALTALAGVAQIAIISATPIPKFKKGGPVGGKSHEAGGTLIEAERGEYVINKSSVSQHRKALDAMNTSSAAFKKFIDEKYVRPAIAGYAMNNKRDGITVNASLNSKSMERKLDKLNKTMAGKQMIVNINSSDSRYSWQQN
jgi:hypothetical protein